MEGNGAGRTWRQKAFQQGQEKDTEHGYKHLINNPITKAARPAPLVLSLMIKRLLQVFQKIII